MNNIQNNKQFILDFYKEFDHAGDAEIQSILEKYTTKNFLWRGMHPFYEQNGAQAVDQIFWQPLRQALKPIQRRQDIFMAGCNDVDDKNSSWVCSMGHLMGLFDQEWLSIQPTKKIAFLRYAEFFKIEENKIIESAFFCDIIGLMQQAGVYPLPPQTGAFFIHPGPMTHDGLLYHAQDEKDGLLTLNLVNQMIQDLSELNHSVDDACPPTLLARTWKEDMIWYGPCGIGATYTIDRYQRQHQYPFRKQLKDKVFNGHICRFAEGSYACFFGWSNLTNTAKGGFLGMTGNEKKADMRVVDIYRRDGDKLAENWVFIDILHYLSMQDLNILERMRSML